jgi:hypothetical protein
MRTIRTVHVRGAATAALLFIAAAAGAQEITPGSSSVTASANDGNIPGNAVDNSLSTRWSASGDGQWLQLDLGSTRSVGYVKIAFYNGNVRRSTFDLQVSSGGGAWSTVWSGQSGGTSTQEQTFDFPDVSARYVRYLGHGNTVNAWNSLTEVSVFAGGSGTPTPRPTATPTPGGGGPSASQILAKMTTCNQISSGKYATDSGGAATISVCGANNGIWWKADMDIDCDGVTTSQCNINVDPWYQNDTSLHTSSGQPFNAATMPYIVIPSISSRWSYSASNIQLGACAAVIYNGKVQYGVFADTGPVEIIGEASYAMASKLGINPDPANGGTDSGVAYLVFPGSKVNPVESGSAATSCGQSRAQTFVNSN